MANQDDDLSDAQAREANRNFRVSAGRDKAADPAYAYAPRWIPTGRWRMSIGDLIMPAIGCGIILLVVVMRLLGYVH